MTTTADLADPDAAPAAADHGGGDATAPSPEDLVEEELLVEEISIDGMCGVY